MRAKNLEGTVLDATYGSSARRTALRNTLDEAGVRYAFVELTAPRRTVEQRLQSRENGNRVVSDARVEDLSAIDKRFEEPAPDEPALLRIESDDDVETTVTHTLKNLVSLLIEQ
jgi:predicted kinase